MPSTRVTDRAAAPDIPLFARERVSYQRPEPPPISEIARYYALSQEERYYSNGGPCHQQLSARLAAYIGGDVSLLPVSSCTLGLMVALRAACGEPPPGEAPLIAVPSFTFTATACAIRWSGFRPLFVDVEEDSWQLDAEALEAALEQYSGRVIGVLACSTFGTAPPTVTRDGWRRACARHGLPLLIDSAAGFGAVDSEDRLIGGLGETEVFSFHATKPFATGEGGAIVTADPAFAERAAQIMNFGHDTDRVSVTAGLNAKMSELEAAAALAMLDRYGDTLPSRRATARQLQEKFAAYPLTYQALSEGSTWQVFQVLMPDHHSRQRALSAAERLNIEVRAAFDPPLHRHPAFAEDPRASALPVTERIAARTLSLPMANTLGERQVARMARMLDEVFGRAW